LWLGLVLAPFFSASAQEPFVGTVGGQEMMTGTTEVSGDGKTLTHRRLVEHVGVSTRVTARRGRHRPRKPSVSSM
jgi:hypothetical protein